MSSSYEPGPGRGRETVAGATEASTSQTPPPAVPQQPRHGDREAVYGDAPAVTTPDPMLRRQKKEHGGLKVGSAFFGWLTATGAAILLTALLSAAGTAIGVAVIDEAAEAADAAADRATTIGIAGAVLVALVLFVAYFCGGYVAGRMARFNGALQGLGVWLWAVVIAVVVAVVGWIAGDQYDVLASLDVFPRLPVNEGEVTTAGVIALVVTALVTLAGAVLGGLAGMRYHRRVDRTPATPR